MVHHNSKSSLVAEVKSNQHLDLLLMEKKESFHIKYNESFSKGRMGYFGTKVGYVCRM